MDIHDPEPFSDPPYALLESCIHSRSSDLVFNHIKEFGDIGAPCFVKEDGITTLKLEDVGLVEYTPDGSACCLNGKVC